jgi:hypothetical protein
MFYFNLGFIFLHHGRSRFKRITDNAMIRGTRIVIELLPFDYLSNQKQWVNKKKCISRGITLHTVIGHFQLWSFFVDLDMLNIFAITQVSYTGSLEPLVIVLACWNNNLQVDMLIHSDIIPIPSHPVFLLTP